MIYIIDGDKRNAAWSLPNFGSEPPLCIVPGQSKSNLFSFTSKLRQMVTEKTKQPNPKPKKLLTNMEVLFTWQESMIKSDITYFKIWR